MLRVKASHLCSMAEQLQKARARALHNWMSSLFQLSMQLLIVNMHTFCAAVVGEKERNNTTVNVRTRDNKVHGEHTVLHVIERFKHFSTEKSANAEDEF